MLFAQTRQVDGHLQLSLLLNLAQKDIISQRCNFTDGTYGKQYA
jgi:hypothetical protein